MINKFKFFEAGNYVNSDFKNKIMSDSERALQEFNFKLKDTRRRFIDIYQYGLIDKSEYYIGLYNVETKEFTVFRDRNKKFIPEKVFKSDDFWVGLDRVYYMVYQD